MSELRSERVAERLGLTEAVIRQLRARGYLERLVLADDEIGERLYRAQLAYSLSRQRASRGRARASGRSGSERRGGS
jgi:hypothetical protein